VVALGSDELQTVRAAYLTMEVIGWFVLVPFALAALLTGLVQSLGTRWGLFRHYWVVAKLLITVFAIIVLLLYMQTLRALGDIAAEAPPASGLGTLRSASPLLHAVGALVLLVTATVLAVHKPPGLTPYGQHKQRQERRG
ncbi:MAG: DUF2269 domain-containing protein, partial [Actinobacteria bacterium]|nr:DUF2269 domain-containing protein [Actinomycetota bacterium]